MEQGHQTTNARWDGAAAFTATDAVPLALLDSLSESVVVADALRPGFPIVYVNATFAKVTGYAPDDVLGQNCRFMQGADTESEAIAKLSEGLRNGMGVQLELWNYRRDGERFRNHLSISPVRNSADVVVQFIAVQRDVTLQHEQVQRWALSQRLATVGQLTAGIAHDLNNLVTGILGTSELLATQVEHDAAASRTAATLRDASRQAVAHLRRLTSLARRHPGQAYAVEVEPLFEHLLRFLRPSLPPSVHLAASVAPDARLVWAEPVQLESALLNLVTNARDAMQPGGGHIRLSARLRASDRVDLCVEDDGVGMDAETRLNAREAFFTTKPAGQGTGLGLTMVHEFVAAAGGEMNIRSAKGQGTAVHLVLPVAEDLGPVQTMRSGAAHRAAAETGGRSRRAAFTKGVPALRVILVEDDPVVRLAAGFMLEYLGHVVTVYDSADAALDALARGLWPHADLLITDLRMPGQHDGLDVLQAVLLERPGMARVLASASTSELGAVSDAPAVLLAKPYELADVARAIRQAVLEHAPGLLGPKQARQPLLN